MQSTTTTRRALVTGLAAGTAVAATGLPAAAAEHPDADLLALGRQLDGLIARYEIAETKWAPHDAAWFREIVRMRDTMPNTEAAWREAGARVAAEHPVNHEHPDRVMEDSDAPSRAIMALPAATIAGLAVKARLCRFACGQGWDEPFDGADWDVKAIRQLVEAVEALAGQGEA
jgi:hypothetical protein